MSATGYTIRVATVEDAPALAGLRAAMAREWAEEGQATPERLAALEGAAQRYFAGHFIVLGLAKSPLSRYN